MNASTQTLQTAARPGQLTNRGSAALAAPSVSEKRERLIRDVAKAYGLLCEAANTFDRQQSDRYFNEANELLVVDGISGVEVVANTMLQALIAGSVAATRGDVAETVAKLVGSFPNFGKAESRLFGSALAEDVAATEPSAMALSIMARQVRRSSKFVPTISEVLAVLDEAEALIARGWTVIDYLTTRWKARSEMLTSRHEAWIAERLPACRLAITAGDDLRSFAADVIRAAKGEDDEVPF